MSNSLKQDIMSNYKRNISVYITQEDSEKLDELRTAMGVYEKVPASKVFVLALHEYFIKYMKTKKNK